jgi:hypothetical protein
VKPPSTGRAQDALPYEGEWVTYRAPRRAGVVRNRNEEPTLNTYVKGLISRVRCVREGRAWQARRDMIEAAHEIVAALERQSNERLVVRGGLIGGIVGHQTPDADMVSAFSRCFAVWVGKGARGMRRRKYLPADEADRNWRALVMVVEACGSLRAFESTLNGYVEADP